MSLFVGFVLRYYCVFDRKKVGAQVTAVNHLGEDEADYVWATFSRPLPRLGKAERS